MGTTTQEQIEAAIPIEIREHFPDAEWLEIATTQTAGGGTLKVRAVISGSLREAKGEFRAAHQHPAEFYADIVRQLTPAAT